MKLFVFFWTVPTILLFSYPEHLTIFFFSFSTICSLITKLKTLGEKGSIIRVKMRFKLRFYLLLTYLRIWNIAVTALKFVFPNLLGMIFCGFVNHLSSQFYGFSYLCKPVMMKRWENLRLLSWTEFPPKSSKRWKMRSCPNRFSPRQSRASASWSISRWMIN